jgi:hypothetical protein
LVALAASVFETAAQTPRPAAEILSAAEATAAAQHKSVWLIFHASW